MYRKRLIDQFKLYKFEYIHKTLIYIKSLEKWMFFRLRVSCARNLIRPSFCCCCCLSVVGSYEPLSSFFIKIRFALSPQSNFDEKQVFYCSEVHFEIQYQCVMSKTIKKTGYPKNLPFFQVEAFGKEKDRNGIEKSQRNCRLYCGRQA